MINIKTTVCIRQCAILLLAIGISSFLLEACTSGDQPADAQSETEIMEVWTQCDTAFKMEVKADKPDKPEPPILLLEYVTFTDKNNWLMNSDLITPDIEPKVVKPDEMVIEPGGAKGGTLVCIMELRGTAGTYQGGATAYRIHWWVRLVNWGNGAVIDEITFTGGKPPSMSGVDAYGDPPRDQFVEWLNLKFR